MKKKRLLSLFLATIMVFTAVLSMNMIALADEITYAYEPSTGVLTISGTGEMTNYDENNLLNRPWHVYADSVSKIVFEEGVTSVGDYAFSRFSQLEEVELSSTITTLGTAAFAGNDSLKEINVPSTVTNIGDYAFGFKYDMTIADDFVAYCEVGSAAQEYCVRSYVPFDTQMVDGSASGVVLAGGQQLFWSFVAPADGQLTFYSVGNKDTFGLLYDAEQYVYNSSCSEMKKSALTFNDDGAGGVNFKIVYNVKAGHRYYMAAKFSLNSRYKDSSAYEDGVIAVKSSFQCTTHTAAEPIIDTIKEANCTEAGSYVETINCVNCGAQISQETKTVKALGHNFVNYVSNDNATCTENATETAKCERCDATDTKDIENSKLEHNYNSVVTAPTCTERGYTTYTCIDCEHSYIADYKEALGHKENTPVEENRVEATCEADGSYDLVVYCLVCEEELSRDPQTIEALGHDFAITAFVDGVATVECQREECEKTFDLTFMDYYNTAVAEDEGAILDINDDGFINAKDFAILRNSDFTK